MGGFAFEIPENLPETRRFLPSDAREHWFLTHGCLKLLSRNEASHDVIPKISSEEIKSKSKANGLAKALVCVQTLYFIAQCLSRRQYLHCPCYRTLRFWDNILIFLYSRTENSI